MKNYYLFCLLGLLLGACMGKVAEEKPAEETPAEDIHQVMRDLKALQEANSAYKKFFDEHPAYYADGFDFPVGKPNAKGYYNAQGFTKNNHLGEDWNANTGGNSDLGDPIYAISNAYVYSAKHEGPGWGNVIRLIHYVEGHEPLFIESIYAHCDSMWVKNGAGIKKGEQIGTIGNADGAYLSHLHLELRDSMEMPIGGGYSADTRGFLEPTKFIQAHRD